MIGDVVYENVEQKWAENAALAYTTGDLARAG